MVTLQSKDKSTSITYNCICYYMDPEINTKFPGQNTQNTWRFTQVKLVKHINITMADQNLSFSGLIFMGTEFMW